MSRNVDEVREVRGVLGMRRLGAAFRTSAALAAASVVVAAVLAMVNRGDESLRSVLAVLVGGGGASLCVVLNVVWGHLVATTFRTDFRTHRVLLRGGRGLGGAFVMQVLALVAWIVWPERQGLLVWLVFVGAAIGAAALTFFAWAAHVRTRVRSSFLDRVEAQLKGKEPLVRVAEFAAHLRGDGRRSPFSYRGWILRDLPAIPFRESSEFPWLSSLEKNWESIRDEYDVVAQDELQPYRYPGLASKKWTHYWLFRGGIRVEENAKRCPKTVALIESLPVKVDEVMFSVLAPGGRIPAHVDPHNIVLTSHLGLHVPPDSGLRAGDQSQPFREGHCLVFDQSFDHEAWNLSGVPRVTLLVDFFKPEVSAAESAAILGAGSIDDAI